MRLNRLSICAFAVLGLAIIVGCSETTNVTEPPPPGPEVDSIAVVPDFVAFDELGQQQQFIARAFDANGGEISVAFNWASTDEAVAVVNVGGVAVASGPGSSFIIASAGGASDSATVRVTVGGVTIRSWVAGVDGDWEDPTKWTGGEVPQPGDVVEIDVPGDYTVTINQDLTVNTLFLGDPSVGTPTLVTGANTLTIEGGRMEGAAEIDVAGLVSIVGPFIWRGGNIRGGGTVEVKAGVELVVESQGASVELEAKLINRGIVALLSDANLQLRSGTIENRFGALFAFRGDGALVETFPNTKFTNEGSIQKTDGAGLSRLSSGAGTFTTTGRVEVESGELELRNGTWRGVFDIESGAVVTQAGTTTILSVESRGAGSIRFAGNVTLENATNQLIDITNLILDVGAASQVSGPAGLQIAGSLLWRQGTFAGPGNIFIFKDATVRFEGTGTRRIDETNFVCNGTVLGQNMNTLTLVNGARIDVTTVGRWIQEGAGTIGSGFGGGFVHMQGQFEKTDSGAFNIEPDFTCSGTMTLLGEAVAVTGAFELTENGEIRGGGTDDLRNNRRLVVINAPSAVLNGTIEVGVDNETQRMSILGAVTLGLTFRVEVDVNTGQAVNHETLTFETGGTVMAGTLAVKVVNFVDPPATFRVVGTTQGTGRFEPVTGVLPFDEVRQDQDGVLLIRN